MGTSRATMPQAEYVLLYYVADPYTGGRVVIGALVDADGVVALVRGKTPCGHCLRKSGGAAHRDGVAGRGTTDGFGMESTRASRMFSGRFPALRITP